MNELANWTIYIRGIWWLVELITMLTNDKRRAVHDFIAGTVVVRTNIDEGEEESKEELWNENAEKADEKAPGATNPQHHSSTN